MITSTARRQALVVPDRDEPKPLRIWLFLTLLIPIYGTCFPPQTYFYVGNIHDQTFEAGWQMPTILLVLAGSIAAMTVYLAGRGQRILHDPVFYVFVLAAFASIPLSENVGGSFNRVLRLLPLVGFGVLYAQIVPRRKMLSYMTLAFLVSACISIFICIFFFQYGRSHYEGAYESAWRGAMGHKNAAGSVYAIGVIVCFHGLLTSGVNRKVAIAGILTCFFMVVKAQSATGLSTLLITLPIYLGLRSLRHVRPASRLLLVVAVTLVIATLIMMLSAVPVIGTSLLGRDATLTGRTEIWEAVWREIQYSPIRGHGYGFWATDDPALHRIVARIGFLPGHSHEDWLDVWLQIGIVGVVALAVDMLYVLLGSLRLLMTTGSPDAALLFSLVFFLAIRSLAEVQFTDPGPTGVFWLVWCSISVRVLGRRDSRSRDHLARARLTLGSPAIAWRAAPYRQRAGT